MGSKIQNVIFHMISYITVFALAFGSVLYTSAEEHPKMMEVTLNHTDLLNNFLDVSRLFYNGEFQGKFTANTEPYLEIYSEPDTESKVEGKLYPASWGSVETWGPEWTKISSGSVSGYVATKSISVGYDAEQIAKETAECHATVIAESINIREDAGTDAPVLATAVQNEVFNVIEEANAEEDGWTCIDLNGVKAYVASEYISESFHMNEAVSTDEEILSRTVEEQIEFEATWNSENAGEQPNPETSSAPALSVTEDEAYLLACMVHVESGAEPYEGQLAVANVILNRVRNPRFGSTISEVIYAEGQFPGAHNGVLDGVLASGPNASCIQAAQEALMGINNIGEYYYFNGYVDTSSVSSYTVIGGHTFYNY